MAFICLYHLPYRYRVIILFSIVVIVRIPVLFDRKLDGKCWIRRPSDGCTNLVTHVIIIRCAVKGRPHTIVSHAVCIISRIAWQPAVHQILLSIYIYSPMIVEPVAQFGIQSTACSIDPIPVKVLQIASCCQPSMLAERRKISGIDSLCKACASRSITLKSTLALRPRCRSP